MSSSSATIWRFIKSNPAITLALLAAAYMLFIAFRYAGQPLLESYGFRQTQTAITSYWMIRDGWKLAYETPVLGYPWALPLEFPVYQSVVALIAGVTGLPLDATGRVISSLFLIACILPARMISRRLDLKPDTPWIFCALLWSSPLYLFWGRSFMIETAAVFFTLMAIPYALDLAVKHPPARSLLLLVLFFTLALLQKVTTALPVLFVIGVILVIRHLRVEGWRWPPLRQLLFVATGFILPLVIFMLWNHFADVIKARNPIAMYLTSDGLNTWNFGRLRQRVNPRILKTILWDRVLAANGAGVIGIVLLLVSLATGPARTRTMTGIALLLLLFPLFLFIQLHFIHQYYQVSAVLFLPAALAIGIANNLPGHFRKVPIPLLAVLLLMGVNLFHFQKNVAGIVRAPFDQKNNGILRVSEILRQNTEPADAIVFFGADWTSEFAYYSERKACMVPKWLKNPSPWNTPREHLGGMNLGAMVFNIANPIFFPDTIFKQPDVRSNPSLFKSGDFLIWLPGKVSVSLPVSGNELLPMDFLALPDTAIHPRHISITEGRFEGHIDRLNGMSPSPRAYNKSNLEFISLQGWTLLNEGQGRVPEAVYVALKDPAGHVQYFPARKKIRSDIGRKFNDPALNHAGFEIHIDVRQMEGAYTLFLAAVTENGLIWSREPSIKLTIGRNDQKFQTNTLGR